MAGDDSHTWERSLARLTGFRASGNLLVCVLLAVFAVLVGAGSAMADAGGLSSLEGSVFSGAVATTGCTTGGGSQVITIDWGDGQSSAGSFGVPQGGRTPVEGSHTYAEEGTYNGTASFHDDCGDETAPFTVVVSDATLSGSGTVSHAVAGSAFRGTVAHFTDADPQGTATDYTATISWADGTSSTGTVVASGGGFDVSGTHRYASAGSYHVGVSISDAGGSAASVSSTVNVTAAGGGGPPAIAMKAAKSAKLKHASWLSAVGSTAYGGAQIVSYSWSFDNKNLGSIVCGQGAPAVSHAFAAAGIHTADLRVTDSAGKSAGRRLTFNVTPDQINVASGAQTVATCENPGADNQPDRADCVKSFAFNLIDVNSRGGPADCFRIENRGRSRAGSAATSAVGHPPSDNGGCYVATVTGSVSLNGLFLPLPGVVKSEYNECQRTVGLGQHTISAGQYELYRVNLDFPVPEFRSTDRHRLGEVPLKGLSDLFGFKIGGKVTLDLTYHATELKLHVDLPNVFNGGRGEPAQGDVTLRLDNQSNGIRLDHLRIAVPVVFLGALEVDHFFLDYMRDGEVWNGGGDLKLGPTSPFTLRASPPPNDNGFGLKHGRFSHAGAELTFSKASAPEVFPGVFLTYIGFTFGTSPTRFSGSITMNVGTTIDVDGKLVLVFASPDEPYVLGAAEAGPNLAPLAGRTFTTTALAVGGGVYLVVPKLGRLPAFQGQLLYLYPGYVEFGGGFNFSFSIFSINGHVGGFVDAENNKFNIEGQVRGCVKSIGCLGVSALVSSTGIGACGPFTYFGFTTYVGVGYRWGDSFPHIKFFDCDLGPYRVQSTARAADSSRSFTLPAGLPSAMIEVPGTGGAPKITVTGPHGESASTPASGPAITSKLALIREPDTNTTYVGINHPAAGRWTVTAQQGSVPISSISVAHGLPAPSIHARVSGHGATRKLSYDLKPRDGQRVTFAERGRDTYRQIGTAKRASGSLRFKPTFGSAGRRTIVALIEQDGVLTHRLDIASYSAPAPPLPSRPHGLRVSHHGSVLRVRFGSSRGALRYAINIALADGGRKLVLTTKRSVTIRGIDPLLGGTVTVSGLRLDNRFGHPAKTSFKPAHKKPHKPARKRRHR